MSPDDSSSLLLCSVDGTKTQQIFPDKVLSYIPTLLSHSVPTEGAVTWRLRRPHRVPSESN